MIIYKHKNYSTDGRIARAGLLLAAMLAGCGGEPAVVPGVKADQGRELLRTALDAWKAGKEGVSLLEQTPPLRVADEDWSAGAELVSFEIDAKDRVEGNVLRCPVALKLKDKSGKQSSKTVYYNVTTAPAASVIRQD